MGKIDINLVNTKKQTKIKFTYTKKRASKKPAIFEE